MKRPCPAASERFDVSRRFRIESGESLDYADTRAAARLIAGEWQAARLEERLVVITRQHGRPRRWHARLGPGGRVRLVELYADGEPEDVGSRRLAALERRIEQERERERRLRGPVPAPDPFRVRSGKGHRRGLVCLCEPPRAFGSTKEAADWLNVRPPTLSAALRRRGRSGGFVWDYADRLLKQPAAPAPAIVAAAREAIRLAGRRVPAQEEHESQDQHSRGGD